MDDVADLEAAYAALGECEAALAELDARCCEPGRSPRMAALAGTLAEARNVLDRVETDPRGATHVFAQLEDAGAQVGRLQIGCCAPNRLPLYADILAGLNTVQLSVNAALGTGH